MHSESRALTVLLGVVRLTLSKLSATPWAVVLGVLLLASSPAVAVLVPIGISTGDVRREDWIYELAFIGMALGCAAATGILEELAGLIAALPPASRLASEFAAISTVGFIGALLPVVPVLVILRGEDLGLAPADLWARALACPTLAAAGAALLRIRLPRGVAMGALGVAVLFAPIALPDPSAPRALLALTAALLATAWLLDHPPGRAS